jgi:hypothetical protein
VERLSDAQRSEDAELFLPVRKIRVRAEHLVHPQASRLRNLVQARDTSSGMQFDGWILEANAPQTCEGFLGQARTQAAPGGTSQVAVISVATAAALTIENADMEVPHPSSSVYADDGFDALISTYVAQTERVSSVSKDIASPDTAAGEELEWESSADDFPLAPPQVPRPQKHLDQVSRTASRETGSVIELDIEETETASYNTETQKSGSIAAPRSVGSAILTGPGMDEPIDRPAPNDTPSFRSCDALRYDAESYEIVLVMDTREIKNRRDEEAICKGLRDYGIRVDVRALKLGDITWMARLRAGVQQRLSGDERECMLDYVVERKRLDDLCSSIRDGRYDDQKVSTSMSSGVIS